MSQGWKNTGSKAPDKDLVSQKGWQKGGKTSGVTATQAVKRNRRALPAFVASCLVILLVVVLAPLGCVPKVRYDFVGEDLKPVLALHDNSAASQGQKRLRTALGISREAGSAIEVAENVTKDAAVDLPGLFRFTGVGKKDVLVWHCTLPGVVSGDEAFLCLPGRPVGGSDFAKDVPRKIAFAELLDGLKDPPLAPKLLILDNVAEDFSLLQGRPSGFAEAVRKTVEAKNIPGLVVILACSENEKSWVDEKAGETIFGRELRRVLAGESEKFRGRRINAKQLFDETKLRVGEWVGKHRNATQTPLMLPEGTDGIKRSERIDFLTGTGPSVGEADSLDAAASQLHGLWADCLALQKRGVYREDPLRFRTLREWLVRTDILIRSRMSREAVDASLDQAKALAADIAQEESARRSGFGTATALTTALARWRAPENGVTERELQDRWADPESPNFAVGGWAELAKKLDPTALRDSASRFAIAQVVKAAQAPPARAAEALAKAVLWFESFYKDAPPPVEAQFLMLCHRDLGDEARKRPELVPLAIAARSAIEEAFVAYRADSGLELFPGSPAATGLLADLDHRRRATDDQLFGDAPEILTTCAAEYAKLTDEAERLRGQVGNVLQAELSLALGRADAPFAITALMTRPLLTSGSASDAWASAKPALDWIEKLKKLSSAVRRTRIASAAEWPAACETVLDASKEADGARAALINGPLLPPATSGTTQDDWHRVAASLQLPWLELDVRDRLNAELSRIDEELDRNDAGRTLSADQFKDEESRRAGLSRAFSALAEIGDASKGAYAVQNALASLPSDGVPPAELLDRLARVVPAVADDQDFRAAPTIRAARQAAILADLGRRCADDRYAALAEPLDAGGYWLKAVSDCAASAAPLAKVAAANPALAKSSAADVGLLEGFAGSKAAIDLRIDKSTTVFDPMKTSKVSLNLIGSIPDSTSGNGSAAFGTLIWAEPHKTRPARRLIARGKRDEAIEWDYRPGDPVKVAVDLLWRGHRQPATSVLQPLGDPLIEYWTHPPARKEQAAIAVLGGKNLPRGNVAILLDVTASMREGVNGNGTRSKWDETIAALKEITDSLPDKSNVSITTFGGNTKGQGNNTVADFPGGANLVSLTGGVMKSNTDPMRTLMGQLRNRDQKIDDPWKFSTPIGRAVFEALKKGSAVQIFPKETNEPCTLIVLTDGADNMNTDPDRRDYNPAKEINESLDNYNGQVNLFMYFINLGPELAQAKKQFESLESRPVESFNTAQIWFGNADRLAAEVNRSLRPSFKVATQGNQRGRWSSVSPSVTNMVWVPVEPNEKIAFSYFNQKEYLTLAPGERVVYHWAEPDKMLRQPIDKNVGGQFIDGTVASKELPGSRDERFQASLPRAVLVNPGSSRYNLALTATWESEKASDLEQARPGWVWFEVAPLNADPLKAPLRHLVESRSYVRAPAWDLMIPNWMAESGAPAGPINATAATPAVKTWWLPPGKVQAGADSVKSAPVGKKFRLSQVRSNEVRESPVDVGPVRGQFNGARTPSEAGAGSVFEVEFGGWDPKGPLPVLVLLTNDGKPFLGEQRHRWYVRDGASPEEVLRKLKVTFDLTDIDAGLAAGELELRVFSLDDLKAAAAAAELRSARPRPSQGDEAGRLPDDKSIATKN